MRSKIAGVKKINILRWTVIVNSILFISSIFISIFVLNVPKLWFYFFCFFAGEYLLIKSYLYKTDSNFYLGFVLVFLGLFLTCNHYLAFTSLFNAIVNSFTLASFFTFAFYKQLFHLFLSAVLICCMVLYHFYRQNILNIYIFFALIILIVFIFSFIYVKIRLFKKN